LGKEGRKGLYRVWLNLFLSGRKQKGIKATALNKEWKKENKNNFELYNVIKEKNL